MPAALVDDPQGYSDRLPAQIAQIATILAQAIDAIDRVAEHISIYGGLTDLTRAQFFSKNLRSTI